MVYMDTSVIVAYYCPEALSEKAEAFYHYPCTACNQSFDGTGIIFGNIQENP